MSDPDLLVHTTRGLAPQAARKVPLPVTVREVVDLRNDALLLERAFAGQGLCVLSWLASQNREFVRFVRWAASLP